MTIKEAMEVRHTVRRYTDRPLSRETVSRLEERIAENNARYGLGMRLVTENTAAFQAALKLVLAKGVRNYIVLAGNAGEEERLGYCGCDVMLYAQTLGLNTWWVGGTYSRRGVRRGADLAEDQRLAGIIAVGYGAAQGVPHRSKRPEDISSYCGGAPDWFTRGVEAVLLAPTALNKQAFQITGQGDTVKMTCDNGIFSGIDLGIGKYHFEEGAGRENFRWA